jgi:hypothetical protein
MKFAQRFVGAQLVASTLENASPLVDAFVFKSADKLQLALINKSDASFTCALPAGVLARRHLLLSAPSIEARDGVRLSAMHDKYRERASAAPYTATVFELR